MPLSQKQKEDRCIAIRSGLIGAGIVVIMIGWVIFGVLIYGGYWN